MLTAHYQSMQSTQELFLKSRKSPQSPSSELEMMKLYCQQFFLLNHMQMLIYRRGSTLPWPLSSRWHRSKPPRRKKKLPERSGEMCRSTRKRDTLSFKARQGSRLCPHAVPRGPPTHQGLTSALGGSNPCIHASGRPFERAEVPQN